MVLATALNRPGPCRTSAIARARTIVMLTEMTLYRTVTQTLFQKPASWSTLW